MRLPHMSPGLSLRVIALIGLAVVALGAYQWTHPAYTDAQIRASIVDTWEVSAWATMAILSLSAVLVLASLALALRYNQRQVWRPAATSILVALCGGALAYANHAMLTVRVIALTGQTFRSWYGLF